MPIARISARAAMPMSRTSMGSSVLSAYRSLNSTAISTSTSTGVPYRRAGENRHCRTASMAR